MLTRRTTRPAPPPILGIDLSLTSTGYSYGSTTGRITTKPLRSSARLVYLRNRFQEILDEAYAAGVRTAVLEGYAMGGKGRVFDLAEWGGLARVACYEAGVDVIVISPSSLKKVVTGNGGTDKNKQRMLQHTRLLWPSFQSSQNDEVDAFCLARTGEALLAGAGPAEFVRRARAAETMLIQGKHVPCN